MTQKEYEKLLEDKKKQINDLYDRIKQQDYKIENLNKEKIKIENEKKKLEETNFILDDKIKWYQEKLVKPLTFWERLKGKNKLEK